MQNIPRISLISKINTLSLRQILLIIKSMSETELLLVSKSEGCTIYTIQFLSKSESEFENFYNTIDYEFWLVVADRPVDITVYLSQLQLLYNQPLKNLFFLQLVLILLQQLFHKYFPPKFCFC